MSIHEHPYGVYMDVRINGEIEEREVSHIESHSQMGMGGRNFATLRGNHIPKTYDNEEVMWSIGDDIPTIIVRGDF